MILEFQVSNFRSFKEETTLSFSTAYSAAALPENLLERELPGLKGQRFLRSMVLYGANASGKSNLLKALGFMRDFVRDSFGNLKPTQGTGTIPFKLDPAMKAEPTRFEVHFVAQNGVRYQYGFALNGERVREEWLYSYPLGKLRHCFTRKFLSDSSTYDHEIGNSFSLNPNIVSATRANALLLSTAVQFNHEELTHVYEWFSFHFHEASSQTDYVGESAKRVVANKELLSRYERLLRLSDLGISGIRVRDITSAEDPAVKSLNPAIQAALASSKAALEPVTIFRVLHHAAQGQEPVEFSRSEESEGTLKFLGLLSLWFDALDHGRLLMVDELDASLHPYITRQLLEMFHNPETNKLGAQLVFTTHDVTLLDTSLLRRDQIIFVEKDLQGASRLIPLSDFSPRSSEQLLKGYLAGRYGGVPFLSNLSGDTA